MSVSVRIPGNPAYKPFVSDSRKRSTFDVMLHFEGQEFTVPGAVGRQEPKLPIEETVSKVARASHGQHVELSGNAAS